MNPDTILESLDLQLSVCGIICYEEMILKNRCYAYNGKSFFYQNANDDFFPLSPGQMTRHLMSGLDITRGQAALAITYIEINCGVGFVGPLAGYKAGLHQVKGQSILVTQTAKVMSPEQGDWSMLRGIIEGMFGEEALVYFYGYLSVFVKGLQRCLKMGKPDPGCLPGQALCIAGPADCGKSLLVALISEMIGGRMENPYSYMCGRTDFNAELGRAEILFLDDQAASRDPRERARLGAQIKEFTVSQGMRIHAKFMTPFLVQPYQRLIFAVNDEPDNLLVLPNIEPSLEDKIILLRALENDMPMPTASGEQRKLFWDTLVEQLPVFHHFLLNEFEIPEEKVSQRFGIKHYHDPELVEALTELSPQEKLLDMVVEMFSNAREAHERLANANGYWVGTALELEKKLKECYGDALCKQVIPHVNSLGSHLRNLASQRPDVVRQLRRVGGKWKWEISFKANSVREIMNEAIEG